MPLTTYATLQTPRLTVRVAELQDLPALMDINGDDEVTRFLPYTTWADIADSKAWFERMAVLQAKGDALQLVVVLRQSARPIGTCLLFAFDAPNSRAEIGFVLGRQHWGHGYMREAAEAVMRCAFTTMGLRRLEATIDCRNVASARLLERLGFVREGTQRQRSVTKGCLVDWGLYACLHSDWQ